MGKILAVRELGVARETSQNPTFRKEREKWGTQSACSVVPPMDRNLPLSSYHYVLQFRPSENRTAEAAVAT